ncbi:hypothetical protein Tco_0255249 [Tanacetum coccineum]
MSTRSGPSPTTNTSAVRNTVERGKEKSQENSNEPASDAALSEFCDKNYNQLLPILAEKTHQEKVQQEKLKAVKARLNFEETSQYSESGAPSRRRDTRKRLGPKDAHSMSRSPEPRRWVIKRRVCPHTPVVQGVNHITAAAETPKAIIRVLAREERSSLPRGIMIEKHTHVREEGCQKARTVQEDIGILNLKRKGQVWRMRTYPNNGYAKTGPFMPRINYFDLPKRIRMLSHVKTYDGSENPKDHLKIFQAAAKVERWAMPTWFGLMISFRNP